MPIQIVGNEISNMDIAFVSITAPVNLTATSSATGTTAISTGLLGVINGGIFYVEVFSPQITKGTTNLDLELWDGASAATGTFLQTLSGHMVASTILGAGWSSIARVTLTAGAHNMTVAGFVDGGTGIFGAGAGTTGALPPAIIRVRTA